MPFLSSVPRAIKVLLTLTALEHTITATDAGNAGLVPRDNPTGFDVHSYGALGESFASGPSAGDEYPNALKGCRRYTHAFGPELNGDDRLKAISGRDFEFIACSGSKLKQVYQDPGGDGTRKPQTSQANQLSGKEDLVTLSMGGNDVGFVNLLDRCIYRFKDPLCFGCGFFSKDCTNDCKGVINDVQATIDGDALSSGLDSAIKAIFTKAPSTVLYLLLYPQFFNAGTDQCDNVQFNLGCSGSLGFPSARNRINPLTKDIRGKMNTLTDNLNQKIKDAVGRATPGNGGSIAYVDPNPNFNGHRFCEDGTTEPSYRNSNIWLYPLEFYTSGTLSFIQSYDTGTKCEDILGDDGTGDWGDYYACELAEGVRASQNGGKDFFSTKQDGDGGDGVETQSSDSLPDWLARVFHPTIAGHMGYKDAILSVYNANTASTTTPDATCSESTISASAAADILKDWQGKAGQKLSVSAALKCTIAGLGGDGGQVALCTGGADGEADYGDMAKAWKGVIDKCTKDGMVGGKSGVANVKGLDVESVMRNT